MCIVFFLQLLADYVDPVMKKLSQACSIHVLCYCWMLDTAAVAAVSGNSSSSTSSSSICHYHRTIQMVHAKWQYSVS